MNTVINGAVVPVLKVRRGTEDNYDLVVTVSKKVAKQCGLYVIRETPEGSLCKIGFLPRWMGWLQYDAVCQVYNEIDFINSVNAEIKIIR